jgi:Protein of unknown function (DUF1778)
MEKIEMAFIDEASQVQLSERDSLRVLDLLENPAAPNRKLVAAARARLSCEDRRRVAQRSNHDVEASAERRGRG